MDNKKPLARHDSICPSPEEVLLEAVRSNRIHKLQRIVNENKNLLSFEYPYPHFGKILYVACSDEAVSAGTINALLNLGASPCDRTEDQGEAIHVVVRLTRSNVLKVLVQHLTKEELNHTFKGNNALLLLIKEGDYGKKSELLECARILIESGINVNHVDTKNLTAILWAIKKDFIELIEIIVKYSTNLDIDTFTVGNKSARELLLSKYPTKLSLPNKATYSATSSDLLFSYLVAYNEDAFISFNKGDLSEYKDLDNSTITLLQLSCKQGLVKAVKHLINNGANLRKTTDKQPNSPLELASENGYYEIVEILLEQDPTLRVSSQIFSEVLQRIDLNDTTADNYEICFNLLLENQDDESLNTGNFLGQTPLHLAVKFSKPKHILELLKKGSSLASKNQIDIMPIEHIDADVLEEHLDECVEVNDVDKNRIFVTVNYKTLLPFFPRKKGDDCESGSGTIQNLVPETDAILYMAKSSHLRHLLTHPVIATYLLLKWYKVRWLFLANLTFYMTFFFSLFGYIFASYGNFHYIEGNTSSLSPIASCSYVVLCVTFFILVLRESFQILVNPLEYYKDIDNWIEVILIFNVGFILFTDNPTNDSRKQLASIAILLSAFEFVLMIGQHPRLTTYVVMFKRVSSNFMKFLAWYFLLIAAFALSFYTLFSESSDENPVDSSNKTNPEPSEENDNFFINPGVALFKTLVMLTGEFDASDINFHSFPVTSKVIFILFVLMIALILLNLLNGLAVSDTQSIKNDAECVGLISRTEHIHYIETMVLGNVLPTTFLTFLQGVFCCFPCYSDASVVLGKPLSQEILMYPSTYKTVSMSNDLEPFETDEKGSLRGFSFSALLTSLYINREIKRKIKKVLQKQKITSKENLLKNKMKKIETEQQNILKILKNIQKRVERIDSGLMNNSQ